MLPFNRKSRQEDTDTSPEDSESARDGRHMAPVPGTPGTPATPDKTEVFESRIGVIGPAETDEDVEAREAYESLMRHRKVRKRKKRIKVGVILGVVAIIGITIVQVIQGGAQSESPAISTAFVTRGEFSDSVSASGSIKPVSSTVVTPEVDGIIQDVQVAEGSAVKRGDRLFSVKNDELDKAVRKAAQQVKVAKNEVSKAQAALDTARSGAAAVAESGQRGDASSVEMAKTDLEGAKISLEEARSAYDDAVAQADKRTVTAPCDGTIIVMNAVNGASVGSPGGAGAGTSAGSGAGAGSAEALITIADLSRMKVTVQINEVDISRIAVDQRARVTFSALRQLACEAQVTHVSTVSSSEAGGSGASYNSSGAGYDSGGRTIVTYAVELLIDSPDASIKPGMTANADIMIQQMGNVLTVPLFALTEDGAQTYVSVVTVHDESGNPQTCQVPVTVRAKSSTAAAIEGDGIEEGTEVLLAGGTRGSGNGGDMGGPGGGPSGDGSGGSGDGATAYGGGGA